MWEKVWGGRERQWGDVKKNVKVELRLVGAVPYKFKLNPRKEKKKKKEIVVHSRFTV